jgi:hypothetical protein
LSETESKGFKPISEFNSLSINSPFAFKRSTANTGSSRIFVARAKTKFSSTKENILRHGVLLSIDQCFIVLFEVLNLYIVSCIDRFDI